MAGRTENTTKECIECRSRIHHRARVCEVCKHYQSRWHNTIRNLAATAGLATVAIAISTYVASNWDSLVKACCWKDKVLIAKLRSDSAITAYNVGDGAVYFDSVGIEIAKGDDRRVWIRIDRSMDAGQTIDRGLKIFDEKKSLICRYKMKDALGERPEDTFAVQRVFYTDGELPFIEFLKGVSDSKKIKFETPGELNEIRVFKATAVPKLYSVHYKKYLPLDEVGKVDGWIMFFERTSRTCEKPTKEEFAYGVQMQ